MVSLDYHLDSDHAERAFVLLQALQPSPHAEKLKKHVQIKLSMLVPTPRARLPAASRPMLRTWMVVKGWRSRIRMLTSFIWSSTLSVRSPSRHQSPVWTSQALIQTRSRHLSLARYRAAVCLVHGAAKGNSAEEATFKGSVTTVIGLYLKGCTH